MSGFVNNSLSNLISSLNNTVLTHRSEGWAVYSQFNLKILLFLVARGFLSDIRINLKGSGARLYFKFKTSESGSPILTKILIPLIKKSNNKLTPAHYSSIKMLNANYSSEFVLVSTNKGLMTATEAVSLGLGGSVVLIIV